MPRRPEQARPRVNDEITAPQVRLIGPEGRQVGVVDRDTAQQAADQLELDLVEVSPQADPPVVKAMDYGKFRYEADKELRRQRQEQKAPERKMIRMRPNIGDADLERHVASAREFLADGHRVRAVLQYRRRELRRPEPGEEVMRRFLEGVGDAAIIDSAPPRQGARQVVELTPPS